MSKTYSFRWHNDDRNYVAERYNLLLPDQATREEAQKLHLSVLRLIPQSERDNFYIQTVLSQLELRLEHEDLLRP